ncbi:hypothetical protein CXF72_05335 [Psychromonas sp. MB-3u-54]|uniref:hypothetical protein n=1 Tax=Psychromonas sp. MB-3u-54 TaxID=2058319 RepID=UPI000C340F9F|nr:hypothetical protein [Psychromonas sp. MB-3u-54]PKH03633.1 hypothetical protein CXF72_05335 [Psychromonas sp. MB-3u-54]
MKKSFLTTSKKVLLATSILAMSTTAMAADDMSESAKSADLAVTANYVKLLTVSLDLSTIDFGDVFTDASIAAVAVNASVTGDSGETFTYAITTTDNSTTGVVVLGGTLTGSTTALTDDVAVVLPFTIDLDTSDIAGDVAETVTIDISYDSIAGTTTA